MRVNFSQSNLNWGEGNTWFPGHYAFRRRFTSDVSRFVQRQNRSMRLSRRSRSRRHMSDSSLSASGGSKPLNAFENAAASTSGVGEAASPLIETLWRLHAQGRQVIRQPAYFIHFGNLLCVGAMGTTDMLLLRLFMVCANVCGIAYNLLQPTPLLTPVAWSTFFLGGHGMQLYRLVNEKQEVKLSSQECELYEQAFFSFGFTPRDFKSLGKPMWKEFDEGEVVHFQDADIETLYYLLDGEVDILRDGIVKNKIRPGKGGWLGEFWDPEWDASKPHFWRVTARAAKKCRVAGYPKRDLHRAISESKGCHMKSSADKLEINDLWGKLKTTVGNNDFALYDGVVAAVLHDGKVTKAERALVSDYRSRLNISDEQHRDILKRYGWSSSQFSKGTK
ncbi:hypothetical protein CYMTET_5911 [Cymbomonas tetramitiformis]|uniref:Cyclic nucleotide-binding domain-containing protein n=1 Tax=Cymbomonas tetramitiformis TaxID=36881 RepID=A0AAE0LIL4_9CHLO|nr:hypothetical protein CYMTET_5911 [Cymbomonas tetramitiformis]